MNCRRSALLCGPSALGKGGVTGDITPTYLDAIEADRLVDWAERS